MAIRVGDSIPSVTLMMAMPDGPKQVATEEVFRGKTVVLFGVPGAFTPTCSIKHLPGFVEHAQDFKDRGVDLVACMAVNDAFVLRAWGKQEGASDAVTMLADGSASFTRALGLEFDLSARGMGVRCQRFALVAKDGRVSHIAVEEPGDFDVSSADSVLASL